ncbi:MAG: hypothetical protein JW820_06580, partial [Spirochaetales bacterium]|nr:hypothetical protein [Spirochaetales bacterium]
MSKRTAISVFMALALLTLLTVPGLAQESVRILISADNFVFDKDQLTVPAGAEVTLVFENKERAPHNVA